MRTSHKSASSFRTKGIPKGHRICGAETSNPNALVLYDEDTNLLSGWNHAADGVKAFANLNLPEADYKINATESQPDPTCDNLPRGKTFIATPEQLRDW